MSTLLNGALLMRKRIAFVIIKGREYDDINILGVMAEKTIGYIFWDSFCVIV